MLKQNSVSFSRWFIKHCYYQIVIYGMNHAGELLLRELEDTGIEVCCGVDRNADNLYSWIEILKPNDKIPECDAMVVTAVEHFEEISEEMQNKVSCPIISLMDVVDELWIGC